MLNIYKIWSILERLAVYFLFHDLLVILNWLNFTSHHIASATFVWYPAIVLDHSAVVLGDSTFVREN